MDMQPPKTTIKDVVSAWHGQLMPLSSTLEMLSKAERHTSEGSQMGSVIELVHGRLSNVLDEMDRASLTMAAVESAVQSVQLHVDKDQPRAMSFATNGNSIYNISREATNADLLGHLSARLGQLNAMLVQTIGDGSEAFHNWNEDIKDNYLWTCQMLAKECEELAEHIHIHSD